MGERSSILFLTTQLPYPPVSGGLIKSYRLLSFLAQHHSVYLVCPLKHQEADQIEDFLKEVPLQDAFFKPLFKPRSFISLLRSYVRSASLNVYRNYDTELQHKVKEWSKKVDLIVVDHYEMGAYVPLNFKGKVILHQHNAEYVLWERLAATLKPSLKKSAITAEVRRIKRSEKSYCNRADLVWAAPNDILKLMDLGIAADKFKETLHLGNDALLDAPPLSFDPNRKTILFVGTLTWEANVIGLLWFIQEVYPLLLTRVSELQLWIVGKSPDARLLKAASVYKGIVFKGFVANLETVYTEASMAIAPLLFGSGMKVKVLEALYRGLPMVTTGVGVEGMQHVSRACIGIADDAQGFADCCERLLTNQSYWESVRDEGRRVSAQYYRWNPLLERHLQELQALSAQPQTQRS